MKYLLLSTFICFLACSGKEKNSVTASDILKDHIEVKKSNLNNSDSLNCKIEIKGNNLILTKDNKKIIYRDLIINEMSVTTNFIKETDNKFSLVYELNASTTKIKEKYSFTYSAQGIVLIYKEVVKYGEEGFSGNRIYFNRFNIKDKSYDDLESLASTTEEEFSKSKPTFNYFDFKNKQFGKVILDDSAENIFIKYPDLRVANILISKVELANNLAYSLEQNGDYIDSKYLLKNIIMQYPERLVAYLNLGDADWNLNNKQEAKKSYIFYISLMKSQNKDLSKIPQRVYERIK